mgnify:CR=1 FL=1
MFVAFKELRRSLGRFSLLTLAVALLVLLPQFYPAVEGRPLHGFLRVWES